jgi:hypothetical protein
VALPGAAFPRGAAPAVFAGGEVVFFGTTPSNGYLQPVVQHAHCICKALASLRPLHILARCESCLHKQHM